MKRTAGAPPARTPNVARMTPDGFQPGEALAREVRFAPGSYDSKARTVEAVFAAGTAVRRWGYIETVRMTPEAGDLSRVVAGQCKLLDSHNAYSIDAILGSVEDARFENGQLVGRLRFADTEKGRMAEAMVASGDLSGISIGYAVEIWEKISVENDVETWCAAKWTLLEVTLCAVPADPAATVRSGHTGPNAQATMETDDMKRNASTPAPGNPAGVAPAPAAAAAAPETRATPAATPPAPAAPVAAPAAAPAAEQRSEGAVAIVGISGVLSAAAAVSLVRQAEAFGQRDLAEKLIAEGRSAEVVREQILAAAAERQAPTTTVGGPRAEITRDAGDMLRRAVSSAILLRANPNAISADTAEGRAEIEQARNFRGMSLLEAFRSYAEESHGVRLRGLSRMELATLALGLPDMGVMSRSQLSTSDFPNILANIATKRLRDAYAAVTQTWRPFCRQSNSPDFKQKSVVALSGLPTFKLVREGAEYEYSGMADGAENYALATYGRIVAITRQALINDDLGAFDRLPTFVGRAAAELENDTVWGILTTNAAMSDTVALFHATHKNLGTTGALAEGTIAEMEQLMLEQKDASGKTPLNLRPKYLVVTPKNKVAAQKLLTAVQATTTSGVNVYANYMDLIVEARLKPTSGAEPYFVIGDPAQLDTIEFAYLDGQEGVYTEQRAGFEVDGIEIKGRLDFAAKAIDWRNMAKNVGV